jgi:EpsI family protein
VFVEGTTLVKLINPRVFIISLMMLTAAICSVTLKPTARLADDGPKVDLETMIPAQFANWNIDSTMAPIQVSPDVQAKLDVLYNQTLSRTYVNKRGERIMLSIAYGGDQSGDGTQVHRPEFCYVSQGFQLTKNIVDEVATSYGLLTVRRLFAVQRNRNEPITYWITVGNRATLPGIARKLAQLEYGLSGKIPDGMLVRISSLKTNEREAYQLHDVFIQELLGAVSERDRVRIAGRFAA